MRSFWILPLVLVAVAGCSPGEPATNTPIGEPDAGGPDAGGPDAGGPPPPPVNGWILLDANPQAVSASIDAAARFSVNHIQLSHDLIMNIEDVLGGDPVTQG